MTDKLTEKFAAAIIRQAECTHASGYKDYYFYCQFCGERMRDYPKLGKVIRHKKSCVVTDALKLQEGPPITHQPR